MRRQWKKLLGAIGFAAIMTVAGSMLAFAADYAEIDYSAGALQYRIPQRGGKDCAIAAISSMEGYYQGTTDGIYDGVKAANGGGVYINSWDGLGYRTQSSVPMKTLYSRLKSGPVIVGRQNRSGSHYSLVVGYHASTGTSEPLEGNFVVMEVGDGVAGSVFPNHFADLTTWKQYAYINNNDIFDYSGSYLSQLVTRKSGSSGIGAAGSSVNVSFRNTEALNITETNAKLKTKFDKGQYDVVSRCGVSIGTSADNMGMVAADYPNSSFNSTYVNTSFTLNNYGITLTPGTTYYYQFFAEIGGNTFQGEVGTFTTAAPAVAAPAVTFGDPSVSNISGSNAKVAVRFYKDRNAVVSTCGVTIGQSPDAMTMDAHDDPYSSFNSTYVNTSFTMNKYGITLNPGTTYYYQFYAVVDGSTYYGNVESFSSN